MIINTVDLIMIDLELALNYFELKGNVYFCSICLFFFIYIFRENWVIDLEEKLFFWLASLVQL